MTAEDRARELIESPAGQHAILHCDQFADAGAMAALVADGIRAAVIDERERISTLIWSQIAIYRRNAIVSRRVLSFSDLAESYAALDALIRHRYEDAR